LDDNRSTDSAWSDSEFEDDEPNVIEGKGNENKKQRRPYSIAICETGRSDSISHAASEEVIAENEETTVSPRTQVCFSLASLPENLFFGR